MSISHELSGEIAAALLTAKKRSPGELEDLKEMLFEIHSTLEQLMQNDRKVPPQPEPTRISEATNTASAASG